MLSVAGSIFTHELLQSHASISREFYYDAAVDTFGLLKVPLFMRVEVFLTSQSRSEKTKYQYQQKCDDNHCHDQSFAVLIVSDLHSIELHVAKQASVLLADERDFFSSCDEYVAKYGNRVFVHQFVPSVLDVCKLFIDLLPLRWKLLP